MPEGASFKYSKGVRNTTKKVRKESAPNEEVLQMRYEDMAGVPEESADGEEEACGAEAKGSNPGGLHRALPGRHQWQPRWHLCACPPP